MEENLVSIVIVNYHQKTFLENCVKSIYDNIHSYPFEIIIVNNSPLENIDYLSNDYQNVTVINNENRGYSHANNKGARYSKGNYLLFLNPDTIIKKDFLGNLINDFKNVDFGAVGLKLFYPDGVFQISFGKENTFINELTNKKNEKLFSKRNKQYISKLENDFSTIKEVDWVSGAALFMRRSVFKEIKGFSKKYFLYYEDADICKRLKDSKHKIFFYPFSEIVHFKGENVNSEFENRTYYFSKESQILYYNLHNNLFNRFLLRIYLFSKFLVLSLITFKKINLKILKLSLGIKND
jgi:GT2 family glycosyltransferase